MGDTRIRYGLALGRMNNFYTGSTDQTKRGYLAGTDGLFKQADTTPDVTNGYLFYTNNSAATTITDFKLMHPAFGTSNNLAGLFEGKVIKVFFIDGLTTIANSTRVVLADSGNTTFGANSTIELMYHTSSWYEICRNIKTASSSSGRVINVGTSSSVTPITVTANDKIIYLKTTSLTAQVSGFAGGVEGQRLIVTRVLSDTGSNILFSATNSSGIGNLYFAGTADFNLTVPASSSLQAVEMVKIGTGWFIPYVM